MRCGASRLQANALVVRVAELWSLSRFSMPTVIEIVPMTIGVLFTLAAACAAFRSLRRLFTWGSASGTVHRFDVVSGRQGRRMFRPAVRFMTRDGREVSVLSEVATSHGGYRVGESVRILYDVRDPERAEIASFMRPWLPVVVLLLFAGVFFFLGRQTRERVPTICHSEPGPRATVAFVASRGPGC